MATADAKGADSATKSSGAAAAGAAGAAPKLELELTKDSVTRGDKTTGLGRVLVQTDSNALADDIADLVLGALRKKGEPTPWQIRVTDDPGVVRGAEVLRQLRKQARTLAAALDAVPEPTLRTKAALAAAAAIASTTLQAVGAVSKLFAHDYQISGREIPVDGLGFDLLVAGKLQFKYDGVGVTVERILPMPTSQIFNDVWALDRRRRIELAPKLAAAAAVLAESTAAVEDLDATRDALQALSLKVAEKLDTEKVNDHFKTLRDEFKETTKELSEARGKLATAKADYDALGSLDKAIADFVEGATTQPADGSRPPVVTAARAEAYTNAGTFLLYVKLVAGGADEIVDVRALRADTWTTLAGATAEYALLDGDDMLLSGTRSALQGTTVKLSDVESLKQHRVGYAGVPDFHA